MNVGVEDLHGHLDSHTGELVTQQAGSVDASELDAQDDSIEGVAVLEGNSNDITRLDTARVSSVVEKSFAIALGVKGCHLRFGDTGDWVFAGGASRRRRRVDLHWLGS